MYIEISIFYVSLIGILGMILMKRREFSTGKKSVISRVGSGLDSRFNAIFSLIKRAISYVNRKTFIALVQVVAYHILLRIRRIYVEIKHQALMNPHSRKVIDAVRGRGEIETSGASFYLRRISTDK